MHADDRAPSGRDHEPLGARHHQCLNGGTQQRLFRRKTQGTRIPLGRESDHYAIFYRRAS